MTGFKTIENFRLVDGEKIDNLPTDTSLLIDEIEAGTNVTTIRDGRKVTINSLWGVGAPLAWGYGYNSFTPTALQTVFPLTFTYESGDNVLLVFKNWIKLQATTDYNETNDTTITLTVGGLITDLIEVVYPWKGDTWSQWDQGIQGIQWETWLQWEQGTQGTQWVQWETGAQWVQWETGAQWIQGIQWEAWLDWDTVDATSVNAAGAVMNSDYTPAHSLLVQQSWTGSPSGVSIWNDEILGRTTGGWANIEWLSAADVRSIINVSDWAIANISEDTTPQLGGDLDLNNYDITGTGDINTTGNLTISSTDWGWTAGPELSLRRHSGSPDDWDYLGQLRFDGKNSNNANKLFAKITGKTSDVTATNEDGLIETAVMKDGSQTIVARQTHSALKLINGTALEVDGTAEFNGIINTDVKLGDNTVTGTKSEFDTALSDDNFAYLGQANTFTDGQIINNTDTGDALFINQDWNGEAINIDSESTSQNVITVESVVASWRMFSGNNTGVNSWELFRIKDSNASSTWKVLEIENEGSWTTLYVDTNGSWHSAVFDGGNVWIGTSNPWSKLEVVWNIEVKDSTDTGFLLLPNSWWFNKIATSSNWEWHKGLVLRANSTDILTAATNGNVWIGTTSPWQKLDVNGNVNIDWTIQVGTASGVWGIINMWHSWVGWWRSAYIYQDASWYMQFLNQEDNYMSFGTNNADRMRILWNGNVWIGTTSPDARLNVEWWETSLTVTSTSVTGAVLNIWAWTASNGKTAVQIRWIDNETTEKAIDVYDENWGNMFYIRSDGTSTSWRSEVFFNASNFNITNLPTSASGLSSWDIWRDGTDLKIVA